MLALCWHGTPANNVLYYANMFDAAASIVGKIVLNRVIKSHNIILYGS